MAGCNRPSERDYQSLRNEFDKVAPLCDRDAAFIQCKEDIISLKPGREPAWLDEMVEGMVGRLLSRVQVGALSYVPP